MALTAAALVLSRPRYRAVHNRPMEKWLWQHSGMPGPVRKMYDVEEVGMFGVPARVVAFAVDAEEAAAIIAGLEAGK